MKHARNMRLADEILRELHHPSESPVCGEDLVNAVVDTMVQANINLDDVTLDEMKGLLATVLRPRGPASRQRRLLATR